MTKKSFKENNPARHYIDTNAYSQENTNSMEDAHEAHNTDITLYTNITDTTDTTDNTNNTYEADNTYKTENTYNTDNMKRNERKTKRLNLLLEPTVFDNLSKIAVMKRTSVNNLINNVLKDYSVSNSDLISKYNEIFP